MSNMQRKLYVDYMKAIGIILVIMGHINFANVGIKAWIYSFHMPLFFFTTGLTMRRRKFNWILIDGKVKSLIVPYVLWGIIYSTFSIKNLLKIVYGSYFTICSADTLSSLWFLPTMFLANLIAQIIINRYSDNSWEICMLAFGAVVLNTFLPEIGFGYIWSANVSLVATSFLLIGYVFEKFFSDRTGNIRLMIALLIVGSVLSFTGRLNKETERGYVLMALNDYGSIPLFYMGALGGCFLVYGLSIIISQLCKGMICNKLSYIGKNTLIIFAIQKPIIELHEKFVSSFLNIRHPSYIVLTMTTINTIVISFLICVLINKYCKCLAGK